MNTFGRLFRISIFGESHGPLVGVVVDGCPPGLPLTESEFRHDLERRRSGAEGTTLRHEPDRPLLKSGILDGKTTGAPLLILFENKDTNSETYEQIRHTPRPGHADFTAWKKYRGFNDYRGGGMFSGRLTTALVAAGVVAKKLTHPIQFEAKLIEAGGSSQIEESVHKAMAEGDSIGGLVECRISGVPVGLGEPFFESVESLISHIVFSIPGVKGIEFGSGFQGSKMRGSENNDEIMQLDGRTKTNSSGGINGGISNGNDIVFRVAVKPTSSIGISQSTIDMRTGKRTGLVVKGRHDACIALRMPVIIEAAASIVIADFVKMGM
ncbi:MAG TPA: chorismate synthase [Syntrophorhabdaceae bacterium]|nr:chorismate synthase [Syntrophorhabdaceae bacterium]